MFKRHRVGAVVLGAVALWLLVGSGVELVDAARGTITGDTAREVPLLFGLVGLLVSAAAAIAALRLWMTEKRETRT